MFRATTPKQSFIFDVDPTATFKTILITYKQNDTIVLEKGKDDLTVETITDCKGGTLYEASFRLSQAEANLFDATIKKAKIQVRALTYDGEAVASEEVSVPIKDVQDDRELE